MAKDDAKKGGAPKGGKAPAGKPGAPGKGKAAAGGSVAFTGEVEKGPEPRLRVRYRDEVAAAMREQFGYANVMQIPRVVKVIINMGVGEALQDSKTLDNAVREMALVSGQKPLVTRAKKSIAAFKLREGNPIGCKVTLRGVRMWEFMDRLFSVALPRIRDFQGLPAKSFDGRGNYTLGIKDQTIFPEISIDSIDRVRGMDITIVTTAETDEEARTLLTLLGLPLRKS
ncbi:MAG: 50S ribosomal protein L5 [bacterium ADurb.Bin429]|nr:MAG: 50S ribosomal protein L5 [bacterium ADurb.Bin429]